MEQTCDCCRFWTQEMIGTNSDVGECVRFPPTIVGPTPTEQVYSDKYFVKLESVSCFPVVSQVRTCGEWQESKK